MRHRTKVHANITRENFRAYCQCGWSGVETKTERAAETDGLDHVAYMASIGESE